MSNETKTQHTPGPWRVRKDGSGRLARVSDETHEFDCVVTPSLHRDAELMEANARLIAAAPELLAALRSCEETLREYTSHEGLPRTGAKRADAIDAARAAIEKAEEES